MSAAIANATSRLRMALDRQQRADSVELWLADEETIEKAKAELSALGVDAAALEAQLREQVAA